jgi:hypothetical protein
MSDLPPSDRTGADRLADLRHADHPTFELVAERGPEQEDLDTR